MACSSRPNVSTRRCRFLPLIFLPASYPADRCGPPFFGAFHALAVDDGGGRARVALLLLTALLIERVMDAIQCAV